MRYNLEPLGLLDCVGSRMRLKISNDDIDSALRGSTAIREHLKSLSDTRHIAQINFQATALSLYGRRHRELLLREDSYVDTFGRANEAEHRVTEQAISPGVAGA